MTTTTSFAVPCDSAGEIAPPSAIAVRPLRIGLIGFGPIGRGFADLLARESASLALARRIRPSLASVLVRDAGRDRGPLPRPLPFTVDPAVFLAAGCDVVVEASGAVAAIEPVVRAALENGIPVVTANKALIAERGAALSRIADAAGAALRFEASVAAGIPLFQMLERSLQSTRIRRIAAILNGTTNFVLTRLARQGAALSVEAALGEARALGFCEADPAEDVSGVDAARKLAILASALGPAAVQVGDVETTGIGGVSPADCARVAAFGYRVKPLAVADIGPAPSAWVAPALVESGHPLAAVENESNGIHLSGDTIAEIFVAGPGAGPRPTAAALLDDVLLAFEPDLPARRLRRGLASTPAEGATRAASVRWFLSISVAPGAIDPSDVVEYVAAAGLPYTEVRRLPEPGLLTIAGITARADLARVASVSRVLRKVPAIQGVRALRVLETEAPR